jgi:hypothetical protein
MNPFVMSMTLVGALVSCARPAVPPEPPILTQQKCEDPGGVFPVSEIEIEHFGCPMGPCPEYRVRITSKGEFEYEGKKRVRQLGRQSARGYVGDVAPLFTWICEHPDLYATNGGEQRGQDTEQLTYRFRLNDGRVIVVQTDIGFEHDDLWVLSSLVDGIVSRELMETRGDHEEHEPKPAT